MDLPNRLTESIPLSPAPTTTACSRLVRTPPRPGAPAAAARDRPGGSFWQGPDAETPEIPAARRPFGAPRFRATRPRRAASGPCPSSSWRRQLSFAVSLGLWVHHRTKLRHGGSRGWAPTRGHRQGYRCRALRHRAPRERVHRRADARCGAVPRGPRGPARPRRREGQNVRRPSLTSHPWPPQLPLTARSRCGSQGVGAFHAGRWAGSLGVPCSS